MHIDNFAIMVFRLSYLIMPYYTQLPIKCSSNVELVNDDDSCRSYCRLHIISMYILNLIVTVPGRLIL